MTKPLIVNNTNAGSDHPTVDVATTTPDQIFRCTDNTIFKPTLIIITNKDAAATRLQLVDADLTDAGSEETHMAETCTMFDVAIAASITVILEGDKIPSSLQFRYGVAGYSTNGASSDLQVYIEGTETFISTTE